MDVEHLISDEGIPEGYKFDQISTQCTVSFPVPEGLTMEGIEFEFNKDTNEIFIKIKGNEYPQVCGILDGTVASEHHEIVDSVFHLVLEKKDEILWAYLISGRSSKGIDPKSLFILGFGADMNKNPREAFGLFKESANKGYFQAKLIVADTYLNDDNPYDIKADYKKGIKVLESIPKERYHTELYKFLANAFIKANEIEKAAEILRNISTESDEARLTLAKLFSPVCGCKDNSKVDEAVSNLKILAKKKNVEAMKILAQHYANGYGVDKDLDKAKSLLKKVHKNDPEALNDCQKSSVSITLISIAAVSVALIGFLGIRLFMRRRK